MGSTCVLALSRRKPLLHQVVNRLLIFTTFHVDEIADDQTTDIAQPKLTRDFICRLQVRLQNCLLHIAPPFVTARIHVDRYQCFGFVDHNVAATLQPNLPVKSVVDLFLHAVSLENRRRAVVKMDPIPRAPRNLANHFDHPLS